MNKTAINPKRLEWCIDTFEINLEELSSKLNISINTLKAAMDNQAVISMKQLENLAIFFNRSLLFFVNKKQINEKLIYSPQFRTINNKKPIHSQKIVGFIERVEKQREIFLTLLEYLEIEVPVQWSNTIDIKNKSITEIANKTRKWLNLDKTNDFNSLREEIENKGIMVILTNGYAGQWQIDKRNSISGFSLYYELLPVIVVKKQLSKARQSFTLLHELAHLLLHKTSMIDNDNDFYKYQGKEKEANEFAGQVLIHDNFLSQININELLENKIKDYDLYLKNFKVNWGVSGDAIMVRLLKNKKIPQNLYDEYRSYKKEKEGLERLKNQNKKGGTPRIYRYREPLNIFGKKYVNTVFDALSSKNITLYKASTYLDNLTISSLKKLQNEIQF